MSSMIKTLNMTLANEKDSELEACELMDLMAKKMNFLPETVDEMRLAFIEALINAKEHANKGTNELKDVQATIGMETDQMVLKVRDTGIGFDPTLVEKPDIKKKLKSSHKRGWGLMLMEKLMDGMDIASFPPSGTLITLVKKRLKAENEAQTDILREKKHIERLKYILGSFIDLSSFLCQNRELESGLRSMLRILLGTLGIARGAIYSLDVSREFLQCAVDIKVKAREKLPVIRMAPDQLQSLFVQEACEVSGILTRVFPYFAETFTKDEIQYVYTLRSGSDMLGLLMLGPKFGPSEGETEDQELLTTISRNISSAINTFRLMDQLKTTNTDLDQKVRELDSVRQASQSISSVLEIENLPHVVDNIFRNELKIGKFSMALLEPVENRFNVCQTGRELPGALDLWASPVSRYVVQKMEPLFVPDISKEKRFQFHRAGNYMTQSFIVIPIVGQDEVIGLVNLTDRVDGLPLTEKDFNLAQLLCSQIKIAVRNANLYKLGITDGLTHLYTNNYFKMRMAQEIARLRRVKSTLGAVFFDVNSFKEINDKHGLRGGDLVLSKVASFVKKQIRFNDIPCRLGGESFGIILPDTVPEGVKMVVEKLRGLIEENKIIYNGEEMKVTCSFGWSMYDVRQSQEQYYEALEKRLNEARKAGPNTITGDN